MSEISCYCEIEEGEPPEYFWKTHPTARKKHICFECVGEIQPGEQYCKISGIWEGCFQVYKFCKWCDEFRGEMEKALGDDIAFGQLACAYNQYLRESETAP